MKEMSDKLNEVEVTYQFVEFFYTEFKIRIIETECKNKGQFFDIVEGPSSPNQR